MRVTRPVSIGGVEFDVLVSSNETLAAEVPDYPVEDGFSVTDTIITKLKELNMTLYLSDNPVTWYNRLGSGPGRVQMVEGQLRSLFAERKLLTVLTSTDRYQNMCITSVGIEKTKENGSGRGISVSMKQVNITGRQTAGVPDTYGLGGASMGNAGTAGTGAASGTASQAAGSGKDSGGNSQSQKKASLLYNVASNIGIF
jgi:hypothetical protein